MSKIRYKNMKIGDTFDTNEGGTVTVTSIKNSRNVTVKHNDENAHVQLSRLSDLNNGEVKNPYYPSVYGVGYLGVGPYASRIDSVRPKPYQIWKNMIQRCYVPKYQVKYPAYAGCSVDPRWHNYQVFAEWFNNYQYHQDDWELDKDILVSGNRVYGPDTCCLVPREINALFKVRPSSSDTSLPEGVRRSTAGKYQARFKDTHIGTYPTAKEASSAYLRFKAQYLQELMQDYRLGSRVHEALALRIKEMLEQALKKRNT